MALQYGLNLPSSNIAKILEQNDKQQNGIRSWRQLFGGASLGFNSQSDALTTDYSSAIAEAYKSNFEQNQAIIGGGLSQGYNKQLLAVSNKELSDTYDTYMSNYAENLSTAAKNYSEEVTTINDALTERADYFAKTLTYAQDYGYNELYNSTLTDENTGVSTQYFKDKGLEWMLDDAGELKSWDDLSLLIADKKTGEITEEGRAYFDAMFNASPQGYINASGEDARSFDEWLSDKDPELREWLNGQDMFNYTKAGTSKGTLNTVLGRESTDEAYERPEYDILLNTKNGGYDNFRQTVKDSVYGTLENKDRAGIESIAQIGTRVKQLGRDKKTYDQWFDYTQKAIDKSLFTRLFSSDAFKIVDVANAYIKDYKAYSKSEFETFTSELTNLLGEKMSSQFLSEYGQEAQKVYAQVERFDKRASARAESESENPPAMPEYAMSVVKELKDLNFDKSMQQLYTDLETFIARERGRLEAERTKTSGF